jgi:hypothetical protein
MYSKNTNRFKRIIRAIVLVRKMLQRGQLQKVKIPNNLVERLHLEKRQAG